MSRCLMRILGFVLVAVALLAAGCTSSTPDKATPKPSAQVKPVKPIDPAKAAVLTVGDDIPLVAKLPTKIGRSDAHFFGAASGASVFGTLTRRAKGKAVRQSHPILYDVPSRSYVRLDAGLERPAKTQVRGMVSSEATVVWVESPEPGATDSDVTVYTYERTSGARRVRTLEPVPDPALVYGSDLTIAGTRILFSMASTDNEIGKGAGIYSGSINSGKTLKVLVEDGQRLTIDGDQMTYSVGTKKFVRDLDSGHTDPAPVSSHAKDATFCGAEQVGVFAVRCEGGAADGSLLTIRDPDGKVTKVGPFLDTVPNNVRLVGPWMEIGSTDGGQEYLLNVASKTIEALPKGTSLGSGNRPELAPDVTLLSESGTRGAQWLVHIPTT